ncbi:MAG: prepilin-type N-terminal cleavage/methylation domain-containing protein [bacterium]|nr:prepilin-type N-terminal cleavage/methylation domain-containing protein [bacterium]
MKPLPSSRGFTLVEVLISLLVLSLVIFGVLTFFESSNRLAADQLRRAEMQQSLRLAQHDMLRRIRMLGRGGLPASISSRRLPRGVAVEVRNNVEPGTHVLPDSPGSPLVEELTDVLTIRGVFDTPIYLVDYVDAASYRWDEASHTGAVIVREVMPLGGLAQRVQPLVDLIEDPEPPPEALILTSPFTDAVYGVVQIDYSRSAVEPDPDDPTRTRITLGFRTTGGSHAAEYAKLSCGGAIAGEFPSAVFATSRVGSVAILEEYLYYIRQDTTVEPDHEPSPTLSRARVYPNTETAYIDASHLHVDVADDIPDLQVALAFDLDDDNAIAETDDGANDEWLLNRPLSPEDPSAAPWAAVLAAGEVKLRFLRLTTMARSTRRARAHNPPEIFALEDRDYTDDPLNVDDDRLYQRTVLRAVVDMRNL